jgi:hypothetical protein
MDFMIGLCGNYLSDDLASVVSSASGGRFTTRTDPSGNELPPMV